MKVKTMAWYAKNKIRHFNNVLFGIAIITLTLKAGAAYAQEGAAPADTSFSIQLFRASPGPYNFFSVESPEIGEDMKPTVGLMMTYQHKPFVLLNCSDADTCSSSNTINAVENFFSADIMGSFNFLKYFQVGLALPLHFTKGQGLLDKGTHAEAGDDYSAFVLGDVRIHAKARILGKDGKDGMSLAVAVIPTLPMAEWFGIGSSDDTENKGAYGYSGDGFLTVEVPKVMLGYRFRNLRAGVSLGGLWRQESKILSSEVGHAITFGAAIGYAFIPQVEVMAEIYGQKLLTSKNFTDSESFPLLFLGGGRFHAGDFIFHVGAGGGIISGIGVPQFQVAAGMTWAPQKEKNKDGLQIQEWDVDGDGVDNDADECPDKPEDRDGFEDTDGCPDDDNDKDGVIDGYDSCPNEPEDKDNFRDNDGCPDLDHDEDGIKEPDDKCPNKAEDYDEFEDTDGCPEDDNDKDGFLDGEDFCPNEPEDKDNNEDDDGCPDLDNDFDGVPDTADKCPDKPETLNAIKDNDGCPDKGKILVALTQEKIELREMVQFKPASDEIRGTMSFDLLEIVGKILTGNPSIRVSIEAHTDNRGAAAKNRELSKSRADAVKKYLIKKGVAKDRLETVGWGPDNPIASNKTSKGRKTNTRVELVIIRPHVEKTTPDGAKDEGDAPGSEMDFTTEEEPSGEMDFTMEEEQPSGDAEMDFTGN